MARTRRRGQHAGLDSATILRTAIRVADRDGLRALSMRRLGAELGVEAMAIYHHFPNKDALLDAMVGDLVAESTARRLRGADWRAQLRHFALEFFARLVEHPNLVPLLLTRPAITTGSLGLMESLVGSLGRAGFTPERALDMVYALARVVLVHAVLSAGADEQAFLPGEPTSRLSDLSADDYPRLAAAVRASAGRPPTYRLEFALDALLAGFAQLDRG